MEVQSNTFDPTKYATCRVVLLQCYGDVRLVRSKRWVILTALARLTIICWRAGMSS